MSVVILFLTFLIANTIAAMVPHANASSQSPYRSGYNHGCDDADISDPDDRYINQPEKGPSFHTNEFMRGYNDGYDACQNENESNNADLPLCDGSYQDCVTDDGYICQAGSTDEECELNGYYCIEGEGSGNFVHGICEDCKTEGGGSEESDGSGRINCDANPDDAFCNSEKGRNGLPFCDIVRNTGSCYDRNDNPKEYCEKYRDDDKDFCSIIEG